jgi:hypothetical protein
MIPFPYRPDLQTGVPNWRPFVSGFVEGPIGRMRFKGLLDTGSIDTVLPMDLASKLGVQLSPSTTRLIWRGQPYAMQFADVDFELMGSGSGFQWNTAVGFASAPLPYILLGIRGCLQFFDATFCGKDLAVELTINRSFSGTVL